MSYTAFLRFITAIAAFLPEIADLLNKIAAAFATAKFSEVVAAIEGLVDAIRGAGPQAAAALNAACTEARAFSEEQTGEFEVEAMGLFNRNPTPAPGAPTAPALDGSRLKSLFTLLQPLLPLILQLIGNAAGGNASPWLEIVKQVLGLLTQPAPTPAPAK